MISRYVVLALLVNAFACTVSKPKFYDAPVSDLGHIDLVLDSADYFALINNSFIKNEFGLVFQDTVYYGEMPSFDTYIAGKEAFMHVSLSKGYWQGKEGSGIAVFQSRKAGKRDSLYLAWKQFYTDSINIHDYKGSDYTLGEVMAYHPQFKTSSEPIFFMNLTSYSADSYRNWGFSDEQAIEGITMKDFMAGWGPELASRSFLHFNELYVRVNKNELKELQSALRSLRYEMNGNTFTHVFNPTIIVQLVNHNSGSKYTQIKMLMDKTYNDTTLNISNNIKLELKGNIATMKLQK